MDLFLQMGYGMMGHAKELIKKWHGGTVILSPRDMTLLQMEKFSKEIKNNGGEILIDPQFYIPRADHEKLINAQLIQEQSICILQLLQVHFPRK